MTVSLCHFRIRNFASINTIVAPISIHRHPTRSLYKDMAAAALLLMMMGLC